MQKNLLSIKNSCLFLLLFILTGAQAIGQCHAVFKDSVIQSTRVVFLNNQSSGNGLSYYWKFGDNTYSTSQYPIKTYATAGTYQICLLVNGTGPTCSDSVCKNIVVGCKSDFNANMSTFNSLHFTFSGLGTGPSVKYFWDFGDGQTQNTGTAKNAAHLYAAQGRYTVCATVTGFPDTNCTDTKCKSIYVTDSLACNPFFTNTNDSTNTLFTFQPALPYYQFTSYNWNFGDSSSSSLYNPSHTFKKGNYTVCLSTTRIFDGDTCVKSYCKQISSGCMANFLANPDFVNTMKIKFNNLSVGKNLVYNWTFGSGPGSNIKNPEKTYDSVGAYTVCLQIQSTTDTGCSSTKCQNIVVTKKPYCQAQYYFIHDSSDYNKVHFVNRSTASDTMNYSWNFGDGSTLNHNQFPSHTYASAGTYRVCLTMTSNSCSNMFCDSIAVGPGVNTCFPAFSYSVDSVNGALSVSNLSTGTRLKSIWSFGDSTFSFETNPAPHQYQQNGIYLLCLFVVDSLDSNCNGMKCQVAQVSNATGVNSYLSNDQNIRVFPVPFENSIQVEFRSNTNSDLVLNIYDLSGRKYLSKAQKVIIGSNQIILETENISPGFYLLGIELNGKEYFRKISK